MEQTEVRQTQTRLKIIRFKQRIAAFRKKLSSYMYEPATRKDFLARTSIESRLDSVSRFLEKQQRDFQMGAINILHPPKMKKFLKEFDALRTKINEYFKRSDKKRRPETMTDKEQ